MPYRRFRRRRRRTRRRRRKPRLRRTRRRMGRMSSVTLRHAVPDTMRVKLKWQEIRDVPNNVEDKQLYSLNGPFLPVAASVTPSQPLYWDQWILFYANYQCYASSIRIIVANRAGNVLTGTALFPSNGNAGNIDSFNEAHTQPYARTVYTSGSNGKPIAHMKSYIPVKKLEAHATSDNTFWATTTENPDSIKSWVVYSASTNLLAAMDMFYDVQIVYYIKFFNRRPIDAS